MTPPSCCGGRHQTQKMGSRPSEKHAASTATTAATSAVAMRAVALCLLPVTSRKCETSFCDGTGDERATSARARDGAPMAFSRRLPPLTLRTCASTGCQRIADTAPATAPASKSRSCCGGAGMSPTLRAELREHHTQQGTKGDQLSRGLRKRMKDLRAPAPGQSPRAPGCWQGR